MSTLTIFYTLGELAVVLLLLSILMAGRKPMPQQPPEEAWGDDDFSGQSRETPTNGGDTRRSRVAQRKSNEHVSEIPDRNWTGSNFDCDYTDEPADTKVRKLKFY
jgi:hypothetical protein